MDKIKEVVACVIVCAFTLVISFVGVAGMDQKIEKLESQVHDLQIQVLQQGQSIDIQTKCINKQSDEIRVNAKKINQLDTTYTNIISQRWVRWE